MLRIVSPISAIGKVQAEFFRLMPVIHAVEPENEANLQRAQVLRQARLQRSFGCYNEMDTE